MTPSTISRVFYIYNTFCKTHFVRVEDLPPILPKMREIIGEDDNILIHLPYKKIYNLNDIDFTERALMEYAKVEDYISVYDTQGNARKVFFLLLKNMFSKKVEYPHHHQFFS